jgi:hypothetical protein
MKTALPRTRGHWTFTKHSSADLYNAPETDMVAVAEHDFLGLSSPILVACHDNEQFNQFCFREGLLCSEVRRLAGRMDDLASLRADKILLLLPGWDQDARTKRLADKWIFDLDRYTVTLRGPRPRVPVNRWRSVILLAAKILLPLILRLKQYGLSASAASCSSSFELPNDHETRRPAKILFR